MHLRAKLSLGLIGMLTGVVLSAAWLFWLSAREEIRAGVSGQLYSLASYAAQGMDNDLRLAIETTRAVAESVPASALASPEALAQHMSRLPMPMGPIGRCVAVDPAGRALAQQPALPPIEERTFTEREYFRRLMETRQPVISKPFRGAISGEPVVIVVVPRLTASGEMVLVMQCSLYLLSERLFGEARSARIGQTGYLFVASRDRIMVLHPDRARILAPVPPPGTNPAADRAGEEGFEGTLESENSAGTRALMSFKQLKTANWFVGAVYPVAEAYRPLLEVRKRLVAFTLLALLICVLFAWLLAGLMIRPLERLTRHLKRLGERADRSLSPLPKRDDEIGELAEAFNGLLRTLREREAGLRLSEEKFAKAFQANPSYATVSRLDDGRFVAVNQGFEQLTGWKAAEVLGRTAADIGLWADPAERARLVEELRLRGEWHGFRVRFKTRSGEIRLIEGSCVTSEIGGEQQIIGVARDITEVARAEEALHQSEEKFSKVFHASPDGIAITRLQDGLILDLNESFERQIGLSRAEAVGRTTREIGLWAQPEQLRRLLKELERHGSVSNYEFVLKQRDGSLRDMVTSTVAIDIGGTDCLISVVRDVTDQRRAAEALRLSQEKFSMAFRYSPTYITITELETGRFLAANRAFEELTGYTEEEALGRTSVDMGLWVHPEMRREAVRRIRAEGAVRNFPYLLRTRAGELRDCQLSGARVEIGGGEGLIAMVRDVTDQKRAEEALQRLNEDLEQRVHNRTAELEEALRELESFSYSISHDLRSPLRAISGYAQIIGEDYAAQLDGEGRRLLERISGGAIRMSELIDDLLDFSRLGRAELKRARIDMGELAREVLGEISEAGGRRKPQLRLGELPPAVADRNLMRQVWSNLLSNAIKYSRGKDPVTIAIEGAVEGDEAHYVVRDNGIGFDMAYADKLFQVFQRLHRDPAYEGTGVGLAIVARIVQRHGGRVWAEGVPGQGAAFHFTLPSASR